jgi:putative heme-binding domain-containing protein
LTEDFVTPGESGEFRPLDIAESSDGRYLYVADWNHPGWTSPELAGRVWRIRRTEDGAGEPPLGGLADTTILTLADASLDSLLANLAHPAYRRRLAAQRELTRRARSKADAATLQSRLGTLVNDVKRKDGADVATERSVRHLLWALIDADQRPTTVLMADLLASPCAGLREQATRALGERCDAELALMKILTDLVWHDPDLMVRREAAIAMGRSRDPRLFWALMKALEGSEDVFVRFAIKQAMRGLSRDYERLVARAIPSLEPRVRSDVWLAVRETYDLKFVTALAAFTADPSIAPELRVQALQELAELHRKRPAWDGKWWSIQPAKSGWPARTEAWEGTEPVIAAIRRAFESTDETVRAAALEAVRTTKEAALFPCVRARFEAASDDAERVALMALLAEVRDAESAPIFTRMLAASAPALRVAAVAALDRVQGDAATPAIEPLLRDPDVGVRVAALEVFARHPDDKRLDDYLGGLEIGGATADRCRAAIASLRTQVKPALEAKAMRGELPAAALAIVREIYDDPLPLMKWKLLGPMPRATHLEEVEHSGDLAAFAPSGELAADLVPLAKDGLPAKCVEVDAAKPHGNVDLNLKLRMTSEVVAYACATLDSPVERKARCALGSDDGVTVWVNGAQVHANPGDRGWTPDQDRFELPLRAGPNTILLRVEQAGGDWSFNVKVSEVPTGPLYSSGAEGGGEPNGVAIGTGVTKTFDREAWRAYALEHAGDAARGKELFFAEKGIGCFRCHAIAGVGPKVGPDLRDVGTKYSRADLVASILEPSLKIQEGYTSTNVFLKNDDVLSGLVVSEKDGVLTLSDSTGALHEIPASDVKDKKTSKLSAMPADLAERLSQQDLADLVAWLQTLKQ